MQLLKQSNSTASTASKTVLYLLIVCCTLFTEPKLHAQTVSKEDEAAANANPVDSLQKERLWFVGASWGNNSSFLGRNQAEKLPFYSTDISYISKSGFWLSAIGYHILNTPDVCDEIDVSAGWSFTLSPRLDAAAYYSKFFFSPGSTLLKSATGNALSGYLGLDWSVLYSRLTVTSTFGASTDYFMILDNSRYFGTGKVLHKHDSITIEPRFSILAGTQHFIETHMMADPAPDMSPVSGPGRPAGPGGGGTTQTETATTNFGVLNYELALPITYSINNVSLELLPRYSIPVNQLEGNIQDQQFFITASLFYIFRSR